MVGIDQVSKWRALQSLTVGDPVDLFWTLRFNLMFNTGMAFSKGSNSGPIIAVVALAIVVVLLFIARRVESKVQLVLIGVVVGGALGNLVDRLVPRPAGFLSGGVVDFIDPQFWPVFNVADACVVVGGILLGGHRPAAPRAGRARGTVIEEVIPEALAGERIDRIVALVTGCSRSEATDLIARDGVLIGERAVTKSSHRVATGDVVRISGDPHRAPVVVEPDADIEIDVVHEDDDVIVVNKSPGVVVHPGPGHSGSTLVHGLIARFPELAGVGEPERPGLVHRLDRGTSGLMVVARTPDAYADLVDQLSTHAVERPTPPWCGGMPSTAGA